MTTAGAHKWAFAPRFRRHAFGWRSQPAVQRVREAMVEIQKVAKKDLALAAAGAVLFLDKVSPALEQVDSSSGAIGTAVNHAIETCAKIIAEAPVDNETRDRWLARLWEAHQNDEIPYIDRQGPHCRVAWETNDLVTFKPVPAKAAARRVTAAAIRLTDNALLARQHRCR